MIGGGEAGPRCCLMPPGAPDPTLDLMVHAFGMRMASETVQPATQEKTAAAAQKRRSSGSRQAGQRSLFLFGHFFEAPDHMWSPAVTADAEAQRTPQAKNSYYMTYSGSSCRGHSTAAASSSMVASTSP